MSVDTNGQQSKKREIDKFGRMYSTGRRKASVARVWIKSGTGKVTVNGKDVEEYFKRPCLTMDSLLPMKVTSNVDKFDVVAYASGGGLSGQAGALRLGISKALQLYDPELRTTLKRLGLLTRDPRVVERKKYGRKKARRSFQFSKR